MRVVCGGAATAWSIVAGLAVLGFAASPGVAADDKAPVYKPAPIDRNGVMILVRQTLSALDQANRTGNYTVFRDLAAPSLATANDAARLGDVFAAEPRDHLDLSGVLVLDPQLTVLPEIDKSGRMRLAGFFPSVPMQVNFRMVYEPIAGQWRLGEIAVSLARSSPVAPMSLPLSPVTKAAPPAQDVAAQAKTVPPKGQRHATTPAAKEK